MPADLTGARTRVAGHVVIPLADGWEAAATAPDARPSPDGLDDLDWLPARVPGTAAGARRDAGLAPGRLDAQDWWFRTTFEGAAAAPGEEVGLRLEGIATVAEVFLNGELLLRSESMFASHWVDVGGRLRARNELAIRCLALQPQLDVQRKPRARWRTRLVADNNLRWFRTMLLGRIPGFAPGPPAVGPWRPVSLERRRGVRVDDLRLEARLSDSDGVLIVAASLRGPAGHPVHRVDVEVSGPSGTHHGRLAVTPAADGSTASGEVRIPAVERWWPHTHGAPVLYAVRLLVTTDEQTTWIGAGRVGFREIAAGPTADHDVDRSGLFIHVNRAPVFVRGALWTPLDIVGLTASTDAIRAALETVRAAGMNMLRISGIGHYESDEFYDLCDELGVLVWQDLMFASMDYPFGDEGFSRLATAEVEDLVRRLAGRPSLAVLCGSSEVEQQVAMLGLDIGLARIPFIDEVAPAIARAGGLDAVYVPSTPFGGELPIRPDRGVTNYYGVGGYRGPLSDARTSGIRFAGECLAFANVPDDETLAALVPDPPHEPFVHHPGWKAGVPRDAGAGWDFDDVRDHYLSLLYRIDPGVLRRGQPDRYLEVSRAVTGEVMAAVFGEWRRTASPCGGGLILWLRDLVPGAGWGVVDNRGWPKTAYHHLRRILAPTAVWLVDEGIGGVIAHVANDGPAPLSARLRVSLYTDLELPVGRASVSLELSPHGAGHWDIESLIGHFVDAAWAYRFGPPAQDVIVASLERDAESGPEIVSQAFHFPAGRPVNPEPEHRLGLAATSSAGPDGSVDLTVSSRRLAYGVRIEVPGFAPADDAFTVEPGGSRTVRLQPRQPGNTFAGGGLTALNLVGRVAVRESADPS